MATASEVERVAKHMRERFEDTGVVALAEAAKHLEYEGRRLRDAERGGACGGVRAYEGIHGVLLHRDGWYRFRCTRCGREGDTTTVREFCDAKAGE